MSILLTFNATVPCPIKEIANRCIEEITRILDITECIKFDLTFSKGEGSVNRN